MPSATKKSAVDTAPAPDEQVDLKAAAAAAFQANPKAKLFHQTSDGQCFDKETNAKQHARRLGDNEVEEVTPQAEESATPEA